MRNLSRIGKKGGSEDVAWPEIIFIVLILTFMSVFFIFVKNSISGASIYEEIYAKKIALIFDSAQPGTDIILDVNDAYKLFAQSGKNDSYKDMIKVDFSKKEVTVSIGLKSKGYSYSYSSDNIISMLCDNRPDTKGNANINCLIRVA